MKRETAVCWCNAPVQQAQDHECKQCGDHCELARYYRGLPIIDKRPRQLSLDTSQNDDWYETDYLWE